MGASRREKLDALVKSQAELEKEIADLDANNAVSMAAAKKALQADYERFLKFALVAITAILLYNATRRKKIHKPPASTINSIVRLLYSKRTYERIFMQLVIDLREEHAEALYQGRTRLAKWIAMRGNVAMILTMAAHAFASCGKAVVKIWKLTL
jgi:hypothetical protein